MKNQFRPLILANSKAVDSDAPATPAGNAQAVSIAQCPTLSLQADRISTTFCK